MAHTGVNVGDGEAVAEDVGVMEADADGVGGAPGLCDAVVMLLHVDVSGLVADALLVLDNVEELLAPGLCDNDAVVVLALE